MATDSAQPQARGPQRHKHLSIRLRLLRVPPAQWEVVQAWEWNARGFNFRCPHELPLGEYTFARALARFVGTLVWQSDHADEQELRDALINQWLYDKARQAASDPALHTRLLRLLRENTLQAQKLQALAAMGVDTSEQRMQASISAYQREHPQYRYGVKVQSAEWEAVVAGAQGLSDTVQALEQWSQRLGGGSTQTG